MNILPMFECATVSHDLFFLVFWGIGIGDDMVLDFYCSITDYESAAYILMCQQWFRWLLLKFVEGERVARDEMATPSLNQGKG